MKKYSHNQIVNTANAFGETEDFPSLREPTVKPMNNESCSAHKQNHQSTEEERELDQIILSAFETVFGKPMSDVKGNFVSDPECDSGD